MNKPYISPETKLNELTLKSVIIGATLSVVLGAANAYFGLFSGLTVSASIPAAVISMAILKAFKSNCSISRRVLSCRDHFHPTCFSYYGLLGVL